MNTTKIGMDFENRVFKLFSSILENDELSFVSQKYSKIYQHKKYQRITGRFFDPLKMADVIIMNGIKNVIEIK